MTAPTLGPRPVLPPSTPPPTVSNRAGAPAVLPGTHRANRSRVRTQWLVLAAALTVLAGTLVAWALTRAAARVQVVSIARPVVAGTEFTAADLALTPIAFDGEVRGLVPAASLERLIGRTATMSLEPGSLVMTGMWATAATPLQGEQTIGALLDPGRFPAGIEAGSRALAVAIEAVGDDGALAAAPMAVRVVDVITTERGELQITLAAADADAVVIARLAAVDALVLVGLPGDTATATTATTAAAADGTGDEATP